MTEEAKAYADALEHMRLVNQDIDAGLEVEHIYDFYFEIADIAWMLMPHDEQVLYY